MHSKQQGSMILLTGNKMTSHRPGCRYSLHIGPLDLCTHTCINSDDRTREEYDSSLPLDYVFYFFIFYGFDLSVDYFSLGIYWLAQVHGGAGRILHANVQYLLCIHLQK